jgi:hypothetical protein
MFFYSRVALQPYFMMKIPYLVNVLKVSLPEAKFCGLSDRRELSSPFICDTVVRPLTCGLSRVRTQIKAAVDSLRSSCAAAE